VQLDGQPAEGKIQVLLKRVEEQIDAGRTMSPPGDNAMGTWLQVVGLMQPASETSVGLLSAFATRLRDAATSAQTSGKVALAIDLSVFADQASEIVVRETAARYAAINAQAASVPPGRETVPVAPPSPPPPDAPPAQAIARMAESSPVPSGPSAIPPTLEPASATVRADPPRPDPARESGSDATRAADQAKPFEQGEPARAETASSGAENSNPASSAQPQRDGQTSAPAEADSTVTVAVVSEAQPQAATPHSGGPVPSAAPPPSPAPAADTTDSVLPKDMVELLVRRGDSMMALKDISAARKFYEFAAATGNGHAAEALARTYDPDFITQMGIRGIVPDPARAKFWYQRAIDAGNTAAAARLQALNLRTSR
jgi:hypothetical protein